MKRIKRKSNEEFLSWAHKKGISNKITVFLNWIGGMPTVWSSWRFYRR